MRKKVKISAHEINKFTYCPYQWYYGRVYGQRALKEKYQAISRKREDGESAFIKGIAFHKKYYRQYRLKRFFRKIMIGIIVFFLIGGVIKWLS